MKFLLVVLVAVTSTTAVAQSPPSRYAGQYRGALKVLRLPYERANALCHFHPFMLGLGCAFRKRGSCLIVTTPYATQETIYHETGHCNGWSAAHEP